MGVQRFSPYSKGVVQPNRRGRYVSFEDYDQLQRDLDLLLGAVKEQMETEYSEAAIRYRDFDEFPADKRLYELAEEVEGRREERK